ncbi:MAG: tRNA (N6-threonylcarbamoyladenosine(37)-N6)-methyltransferase TrmO [Christensenellales bacterium]|jgi:tRNA-Thr(GGU) m(6)t(6)A37 methyltransferase TsaA
MNVIQIARVETDFPTKFGIPRQSGVVPELTARVVFEPEFRNPDAVRGLEGFSHIWLIWGFSQSRRDGWSATVRPPRLGGNTRMGVFATRAPYRPNPIGLSAVRLIAVDGAGAHAPTLLISGADLMDQTPIYDIKPYLPQFDAHPGAVGGFSDACRARALEVVFPEKWREMIPPEKRAALIGVLASDPRPAYQHDPDRVYGFAFAGFDVRFRVDGDVLTVCEIVRY